VSTMMGLLALAGGLFIGLAVILMLAPTGTKQAAAAAESTEGRPAEPGQSANAAERTLDDVRASGKTCRAALDFCFIIFVIVATLSVLVYEYKLDPLVELARMFPSETRVVSDVLRRLREDWPSKFFQASK